MFPCEPFVGQSLRLRLQCAVSCLGYVENQNFNQCWESADKWSPVDVVSRRVFLNLRRVHPMWTWSFWSNRDATDEKLVQWPMLRWLCLPCRLHQQHGNRVRGWSVQCCIIWIVYPVPRGHLRDW